jgi:hypothetical protein
MSAPSRGRTSWSGAATAAVLAWASGTPRLAVAIPYTPGFPTVLAQEARLVFGAGPAGHVLFFVLQAATAAILFTGGNTSFTGFAMAGFGWTGWPRPRRRTHITGLEAGRRVRLRGMVGTDGHPTMINSGYELLGSMPRYQG